MKSSASGDFNLIAALIASSAILEETRRRCSSFAFDLLNFGEHEGKTFVVELRGKHRSIDVASRLVGSIRSETNVEKRFVTDRRVHFASEFHQLRPRLFLGEGLNFHPMITFVGQVEFFLQLIGFAFVGNEKSFQCLDQRRTFELNVEQFLLQFVLPSDQSRLVIDQLEEKSSMKAQRQSSTCAFVSFFISRKSFAAPFNSVR